ncbi:MAG: DUF1499 domain-containing protein [Alphaproteobacteria bacterium]|jgi:hypothetical protein|uniref:DUF1499 domain-containing protein n=1 Tax=Pseudorhizobium pelagicum TaxID=1509405 RepID=UPI001E0D08BF|nr:DUF1499 domain-containing protein [Alphaproteobacteria bacterium]MBU1552637.1 DUF1499 domain-containing protein [Alphaproteobacteria bacterium]MBU2339332.1 DUF1499 domain-containing protein [Alphaproteobacteria bacterium]MBU2390044.1 DUF1499 domain-containing protein [Alphaproteobacteria bacterium]
MTVRFVRPISRSAYAARRIALAALLLFALAVIGHRFGPLRTPDMLALVLLSAAIAAAAVPLALIGLVRLWQKGAEGGIAAAKALVYAAVPLAVVAAGAIAYLTQPAIYEVATDLEDPPEFLARPDYAQEWLVRPASVSAADRRAQLAAYPGLTGRRYEGALDRVLQGVQAAALSARVSILDRQGEGQMAPQEPSPPVSVDDVEEVLPEEGALPVTAPVPLPRPTLPGQLAPTAETPDDADDAFLPPSQDVLLQGEVRTLALGLPFDIVIRLREDAETTSVDLRVASRYGPHDLGLSAEIAEDFLDRLDAELLGIAGG